MWCQNAAGLQKGMLAGLFRAVGYVLIVDCSKEDEQPY
jgi:hypothetical protein